MLLVLHIDNIIVSRVGFQVLLILGKNRSIFIVRIATLVVFRCFFVILQDDLIALFYFIGCNILYFGKYWEEGIDFMVFCGYFMN